ncbi:MAG: sulfite exporter TauE/SafE family protein [Pirellulaceae bacterium]|nr:sulfite exporter TauE/SafE family protein [Planctomycetales bacterium]
MFKKPNVKEIRPWMLVLCVWTVWGTAITAAGKWSALADGWPMSITMCLGSFVAGATSEGGGAVAFPVMTLLFRIPPSVARDFSLMIQSVGMTAATIAIVSSNIRVNWQAILWSGLGGMLGIVIGLQWFSVWLPPAYLKIFFTSLWLSFAAALFAVNWLWKRSVVSSVRGWGAKDRALLLAIGVLGGIVSGLVGSGLDILTFTMLTLYFRVSEKIATPTSVILMASNACVGFFWQAGVAGVVSGEAWSFWWACVPVVVVGAPLGAWFIRRRSRHFITAILCVSIVLQFVGAALLVPHDRQLWWFSASVVAGGMILFGGMYMMGIRRAGLWKAAQQGQSNRAWTLAASDAMGRR